MIGRVGGSIAVFVALASGALAQGPLQHPPEKFSARPVQPPQGFGQPGQVRTDCVTIQNDRRNTIRDDPQKICFTASEVRFLSKPPVTGVVLVEQTGSERKTVRMMFTLPRDLRQSAGVRVIVDHDRVLSLWPFRCVPGGCVWGFPVDAAFVARLKTAQSIHLKGATESGETATYRLPLVDFVRAIEGPPTAPK